MMDVDIYRAVANLLATANEASRKAENRVREQSHDEFGDMYLILFGDFKSLP